MYRRCSLRHLGRNLWRQPGYALARRTDSAGLTGGISTNDNGATIDVEDLTTGLLTIGGQNTSGVNTVSNNIQLGVSSNTGKSVTLVAAPGGEVLFSGELLSNGTNTTAGVTVGNASNTGIVKLSARTRTAAARLSTAARCCLATFRAWAWAASRPTTARSIWRASARPSPA